jgi:uncharacterized protein (TIRG00374 family)
VKARLSILAGLGVSAALLWLALRNIDAAGFYGQLSRVRAAVLIPVFAVYMLELTFRSMRWKLLLDAAKPVRFIDSFRLESSALALSNILPLRLGEVARGTYGARLLGIPAATVFSTMLVERAMDATMLTLMFIAAAGLGAAPGGVRPGGWIWLLPAFLAAAVAALALADKFGSHRTLVIFSKRLGRLEAPLRKLAAGARALHSPRKACAALTLAALQWLMNALNLYLVAAAFGISGAVGPLRSVTLLFTGAMAVSVPGVPGYFGNFEFAIAKTAASWGVPKDTAFAYAAFSHISSYAIFTTVGLLALYGMGRSISGVWGRFGLGKAEEPLPTGTQTRRR